MIVKATINTVGTITDEHGLVRISVHDKRKVRYNFLMTRVYLDTFPTRNIKLRLSKSGMIMTCKHDDDMDVI